MDDPDKELSDASSGFEDDDEEEDDGGEFATGGYHRLAQNSDEESDDEGASDAAAARAPLETDKAEKIKSLMAGFKLPEAAVPEWAKAVPEDVWKEQLVESLQHPEASRAKNKVKSPAPASAIDPDLEFPDIEPPPSTGDQPGQKRKISFSGEDDELMDRVRTDVGLECNETPATGGSAAGDGETHESAAATAVAAGVTASAQPEANGS